MPCECFWGLGPNKSCGVAIFIFNSDTIVIDKFEYDLNGRFIFVDVKIDNVPYRLINIYAPTNERERQEFFSHIQCYMSGTRSIILGGDFNFVHNPILDKYGTSASFERGTIGSKEIIQICRDFSVDDIFRKLNPRKNTATWHCPSKDIHCRLDRFYISRNIN